MCATGGTAEMSIAYELPIVVAMILLALACSILYNCNRARVGKPHGPDVVVAVPVDMTPGVYPVAVPVQLPELNGHSGHQVVEAVAVSPPVLLPLHHQHR